MPFGTHLIIRDSPYNAAYVIFLGFVLLISFYIYKRKGGVITPWKHETTTFGKVVKSLLLIFILFTAISLLFLLYLWFHLK